MIVVTAADEPEYAEAMKGWTAQTKLAPMKFNQYL